MTANEYELGLSCPVMAVDPGEGPVKTVPATAAARRTEAASGRARRIEVVMVLFCRAQVNGVTRRK